MQGRKNTSSIFHDSGNYHRGNSEICLAHDQRPEYGFFGDEFYTIALSGTCIRIRRPAAASPSLVALSRTLLGESLFAYTYFGARRSGHTGLRMPDHQRVWGRLLHGLAPWASSSSRLARVDSIFCYDSIDQLVCAFLIYARRSSHGNRRLWVVLGLIAGIPA